MCETVLRVSPRRLQHNFEVVKQRLSPDVKILVNLKANAYGHGAVLTGKVLQSKADYFSVACQAEGTELRENGIDLPVLVYNPPVEWNRAFFDADLEPAVYDVEQAARLMEFVRSQNISRVKIHVKLDTGMHRSGLMPDRVEDLIALLRSEPRIKVEGVFSHLAAADDPAEESFTRRQIDLFDRLSRKFYVLNPSLIRHLANSSAIYAYPEAHFDMVRPGLSIYGISPVEGRWKELLKPAAQMVSRITQLRRVPRGDTVGYNRMFTAPRDSTIALIPAGYADGYKRALGLQKGYVLVNGRKAPVVGKVNMDMLTVDVTDIPVAVGDLAVLFGDRPRADELARLAGTIPYEITTTVGARVKRLKHNF